MRPSSYQAALAFLFFTVACGEKKTEAPPPPPPAPTNALSSSPITPCPTCKLIDVTLTTDDKGNYFSPKEIEAHEGDVVRFKLVMGVHNVHFLPDSNPGKSGLPPMGEMFQLPGQEQYLLLKFGKGKFYFQCDPHAALGMTGHIKVED